MLDRARDDAHHDPSYDANPSKWDSRARVGARWRAPSVITVQLDKLADTAGATSMVHSLVVNGSAGVFALGGVMLYNAGQRSQDDAREP